MTRSVLDSSYELLYHCNLVVLIIFLMLVNLEADKYAGEVFTLGFDARSQAMGGTFIANSYGVTSVSFNPAGLNYSGENQLLLAYSSYFNNLANLEFLAFSAPSFLSPTTGLGVGLFYYYSGDIKATDATATGEPYITNLLNYNVLTLYIGGGKSISPKASWGMTLKLIREDASVATALGIGVDWGYKIKLLPVVINILLKDALTTPIFWSTGKTEYIFPTLSLGLLGNLTENVSITNDLVFFFEERKISAPYHFSIISLEPHLGGELRLANIFSLRAGIDRGNVTLGGGIQLFVLNSQLSFDYALLAHADLGGTHKLSLKAGF